MDALDGKDFEGKELRIQMAKYDRNSVRKIGGGGRSRSRSRSRDRRRSRWHILDHDSHINVLLHLDMTQYHPKP